MGRRLKLDSLGNGVIAVERSTRSAVSASAVRRSSDQSADLLVIVPGTDSAR